MIPKNVRAKSGIDDRGWKEGKEILRHRMERHRQETRSGISVSDRIENHDS